MKKSIISIGVLTVLAIISVCVPARSTYYEASDSPIIADTVYPPEISILPPELHVNFKQGDFVIKDITILNRGGQPLEIYGMRGSCYCANAAVIHPFIVPFSKGIVRLSVNTKNLSDSIQRIDYSIKTNTPDSTVQYRVFLHLIAKDTTIVK
ncbi:MAG: hypothetical protein U0264_17960 [Candidatus Kapaibacterium sp.]